MINDISLETYKESYNYLNDLQAEFLEHSEAYSAKLLIAMEIALDCLDEKINNIMLEEH